MNLKMIDFFERAIMDDGQADLADLVKAGLLSPEKKPDITALNLLPAEYVSPFVDALTDLDMDMKGLQTGLGRMLSKGQDMGVFFALLYLFEAVDFQVPRYFMQLPSSPAVLHIYLSELLLDIQDCCEDME